MHRLPVIEPLESAVQAKRWAIKIFLVFRELLCGFQSLVQRFDVLYHHAVAVLLEIRVVQVFCCWLAVHEVDGGDFYEMLDLPQAGVVLGDVLYDGDVWFLLIESNISKIKDPTQLHKLTSINPNSRRSLRSQ